MDFFFTGTPRRFTKTLRKFNQPARYKYAATELLPRVRLGRDPAYEKRKQKTDKMAGGWHHENEFKFSFLEGNIIVLIEIRIELRGEKFCMGICLAVPKI